MATTAHSVHGSLPGFSLCLYKHKRVPLTASSCISNASAQHVFLWACWVLSQGKEGDSVDVHPGVRLCAPNWVIPLHLPFIPVKGPACPHFTDKKTKAGRLSHLPKVIEGADGVTPSFSLGFQQILQDQESRSSKQAFIQSLTDVYSSPAYEDLGGCENKSFLRAIQTVP